MDFGYKIIRNRLGSLVANAIQKKIDNNNKESIITVTIIYKGESFSVNVNSSNVINAINLNKPVLYTVISKDKNKVSIMSEFRVNDAENRVYLNYEGITLIHNDTTITAEG